MKAKTIYAITYCLRNNPPKEYTEYFLSYKAASDFRDKVVFSDNGILLHINTLDGHRSKIDWIYDETDEDTDDADDPSCRDYED